MIGKPSTTKFPTSQEQTNNTMNIGKTNALKAFLIAAFLSLRFSSGAQAAVSLNEALDTVGSLNWATTNALNWSGQTDVTHDGVDAAASPTITNNGSATFQAFVTGPGTVSYWWKVSSETNNDRLVFSIDGAEQGRISGEVDWQSRSFAVSGGSHVLRFVYQKSAGNIAGQDRAWVDQVQYTSGSSTNTNTNCTITISPTNGVHNSETSTGRVDVILPEGCFWGVSNTNSWITTVLGVGYPGWVDYTVAANPGTSQRTGIMIIGGNTYVVTQLGATNVTCTYSVSPTTRIHTSVAASNSITINTSAGCAWSLSNTNPWISTPVTSGAGAATVSYFVQANSSVASRSGYISVANKTVLITQTGTTNGTNTGCSISLTPVSRSHLASSATGSVTVIAGPGCSWSVFETNSWLSILSVTNGTVTYLITANPDTTGRTGHINIGGRIFTVTQSGNQPLSPTPVIIPTIEVTNIGHIFFGAMSATNGTQPGSLIQDFLIDQDHTSGGGMELPNVSINWDTNYQFSMTVSAPPGMKFSVNAPAGGQVRLDGYLWWESTRGGFSPAGTASVQFAELEGIAPDFSGASPFLSSSHGFFGFSDLDGSPVSNSFSFASITLSASLVPQFTGNGTENFIPHLESALYLSSVTTSTNDPGPLVSIVPGGPLPFIRAIAALPAGGVDITVYGNPGRTHIVQCSLNTVTWTQIASGVMPQSGTMTVRDVNASNAGGTHPSSRFYRIVEVSNVLPTD